MEIKNRLVGALVILAIGSILWPILFHDPVEDEKVDFQEIPSAPHFEKYTVSKPQPVDASPTVQAVEPEAAAQVATVVEEANDTREQTNAAEQSESVETVTSPAPANDRAVSKTATDDRDLPVSWIVQVASFEHLENAEKLRSELGAKGFPAYTQQVKTSKGRAVRVFVGPKLQRSKAEELKQKIDKAFNLNTLVRQFTDE